MGAANLFLSIGVYSYRISNIDSYAILLNFWHLGYALHKRKEILLMKMKRILSLLLSILITVSLAAATAPAALAESPVWDGSVADSFAGGSGTTEDPYQIENGAQLALLAKQADNGETGYKSYVLTRDIDLGNKPWTPIGTKRLAYCVFEGDFDGGGHAVTNLFVDTRAPEGYSDTAYAALFGYVDLGTIRNLFVSGRVQSTGCKTIMAGGIAGFIGGTTTNSESGTESGSLISGCIFAGSVSVKAEETDSGRAYAYAGGIAGNIGHANEVLNCQNNGEIYCESSHQVYVGGIAGSNSGSVFNCRSTGNVTGISAVTTFLSGGQGYMNYVGGIVGRNYGYLNSPAISNCLNAGAVVGKGGELYAGGIVGENLCQRDITLKSALNYGTVSSCTNLGNVSGMSEVKSYIGSTTAAYVGGVAGGIRGFGRGQARITDCYSVGGVSCSDGAAGGVVGVYKNGVNNWMTVEYCYAAGAVTGSEEAVLGGVIGLVTDGEPTVSDCSYYQSEDTNRDLNGIGKNDFGVVLDPLSVEAFGDWSHFSGWDQDLWKLGKALDPSISPVTARPILKNPDESDKSVPVLGISLDRTSLTLVVGETAKLTASFFPPDAAGQPLLWGTSDPAVVKVDEDGNVTAVALGSARIAVAVGDLGAVCRLTVVPARLGSFSEEGGVLSIPVLCGSDGTAILAAYNAKGQFLGASAAALTAGKEVAASFSLPEGAEAIRVFVVDRNWSPLIPCGETAVK